MLRWVLIVLLAIVALLLVAVVVLLALGMRGDAGRIAASIEIDRPAAEVWPWLTEGDKQKQWVSWLVEVRDVTPGVRGPGKRMVWVMDDPNMKQRVEIMGELLEEVPGQMSSVRLWSAMGFDGVSTWKLTDLGGKTRFDATGRYHYHHWMAKLMEPLVTPQARKKLEADMARAKQLIESAHAASASAAAPAAAPAVAPVVALPAS